MANPRKKAKSVPFLGSTVGQRWLAWHAAPLGRSGATVVEAEMSDWSGAVPSSNETVVHVLLPGERPLRATRDLGDGRSDTLVRAGQICVTPAGRPGHWAWSGHFRDLNLVLPAVFLSRITDDAGLATIPDLMSVAREPRENLLIESLVHWLGNVGRGDAQPFAAEIDHAVALVACWLLRQAEPALVLPQSRLSPLAIRHVRAYVEAHIDQDISVSELADLVRLSTPYFSHAFRSAIGEAPYQYVLRRRCIRACELLQGDDDLREIALAVGFATQSHFTTTFRRVIGATPAAWRRARRG